jgi:hypothetical protein
MPLLTGSEVTPDMVAVRQLLDRYSPYINKPEYRLVVWGWFAGLATLDEVRADLSRLHREKPLFTGAALALAADLGTNNFHEVARHF